MAAALLVSCGGGGKKTIDTRAIDPGGASCGVCGMVVREMPAPRGQVVHADGHREFFCGIGDLRAYVQAPSPHGKIVAVYVETLPDGVDPSKRSTDPRPWTPADQAWFVFGAKRPGVMGLPVLAFADRVGAEKAAKALGTRAVRWADLRDTPFDQVPAAAKAAGAK